MQNVMVDLETFGNNSHSVIVSIGAVVFDKNGTYETFYRLIDAESCVRVGLKMDVSTVQWWIMQDARHEMKFHAVAKR
jgi:DNA polymerase III epsilon subunit-like protein